MVIERTHRTQKFKGHTNWTNWKETTNVDIFAMRGFARNLQQIHPWTSRWCFNSHYCGYCPLSIDQSNNHRRANRLQSYSADIWRPKSYADFAFHLLRLEDPFGPRTCPDGSGWTFRTFHKGSASACYHSLLLWRMPHRLVLSRSSRSRMLDHVRTWREPFTIPCMELFRKHKIQPRCSPSSDWYHQYFGSES